VVFTLALLIFYLFVLLLLLEIFRLLFALSGTKLNVFKGKHFPEETSSLIIGLYIENEVYNLKINIK